MPSKSPVKFSKYFPSPGISTLMCHWLSKKSKSPNLAELILVAINARKSMLVSPFVEDDLQLNLPHAA
ncbi:hypothetical protein XACS584_340029 [Xanthomonas citri pv. citri]|nr:hypothetical protein XACS584_340029 [Xanthomonas citri pv. citri]